MSSTPDAAREAVTKWCLQRTGEEVIATMTALRLKVGGSHFANLDRLSQWMEGNYTATDFVEETEEDGPQLFEKHEQLRSFFINDTVARFKADELWTSLLSQTEPHPFEAIQESDRVKDNLTRSRLDMRWQVANSLPFQRDRLLDTSTRIEEPSRGELRQEGQMAELISMIKSMDARINTLQEQMFRPATAVTDHGTPHPTASSTRNPSTRTPVCSGTPLAQERREVGGRVGFQETYTFVEPEAHASTPQPGNSRFDRTTGHPVATSRTGISTSQWSTATGPRDVLNIARKWNLKFHNSRQLSIDQFITKVEEHARPSRLTGDELLSVMPELLDGPAAKWFRSNHTSWTTWEEFTAAAEKWWGSARDLKLRLWTEINARTQAEGEPTAEFVANVQAMFLRMTPPPSMQTQLNTLHKNLHPSIRKQIQRRDFSNMESFLELAQHAEVTREDLKSYKPPLGPEFTTLPEYLPEDVPANKKGSHAKPGSPKGTTPKSGVSAVNAESLEEMLTRVVGKLMDKRSSSPPSRSRGRRFSPRGSRKNSPQKDKRGRSSSTRRDDKKRPSSPSDAKSEGKQKPSQSKERLCFRCDKPGHFARECRADLGNADGEGKQ